MLCFVADTFWDTEKQNTRLKTLRRVRSTRGTTQIAIKIAALGIEQFQCFYAAVTGDIYLQKCFRISGSEVIGISETRLSARTNR